MSGPNPEQVRRCFRYEWLASIQQFCEAVVQPVSAQRAARVPGCEERLLDYFHNGFMGGVDLDYAVALEKGFVTEQEVVTVQEFHELVDRYEAPNGDWFDDQTILADPAWSMIVAKARRAREDLMAILSDPDEIRWLTIGFDLQRAGPGLFVSGSFRP